MKSTQCSTELRLDDHRRIEAICTNFEANWVPVAPDFSRLIRDTEGLMRAALLCELVSVDIELRREYGQEPKAEDYNSAMKLADVTLMTSDFWSFVSDSSDASQKLSLIGERYQVIHKLGAGGIGDVYRAFDCHHQRTVAIKILKQAHRNDAEAIARFQLEGQLTGSLQHPGIPPVYDLGQLEDGTPFFVMKVVEGKTLAELFESKTNPNQSSFLQNLFDKVAQTVAYAHQQGVIHRDLKPQNIMVGGFGEVQVMDWGLAKQLQSKDRLDDSGVPRIAEGLTAVGDFIGTPRHMAPEQSRGELSQHSTRMDVFGLGTILFQILTGETLYPDDSAREAISKIQRGELADAYAKLNDVETDKELAVLCRQCLAAEPEDRPASASEVAKQTQAYLEGLQQELNRVALEKSKADLLAAEQRKRHRLIASIGGLSLIAVSIALAFAFSQWKKANLAASKASDAATAEHDSRLLAEKEADSAQRINAFLTEVLSVTQPDMMGGDVTHREVIDQALPKLDRFKDQPMIEGALRLTLAETYRWLDAFDVAEEQIVLAIKAFERAETVDNRQLLAAKERLAAVLLSHDRARDKPRAIEILREVVAESKFSFGETDKSTVQAMVKLGEALTFNSEHVEASAWLERAQKIANETAELDNFDTQPLILALARVRVHLDQTEEGEALFTSLLENPDTPVSIRLPAMSQLGEMYYWEKRYDDAAATLERSLALHDEELGKDHSRTLSTYRKYFRVLDRSGDFEKLLSMADDSIERHQRWEGGVAESSVIEARTMKVRAFIGVGKLDEAEEMLRESIDLLKTHRGKKSKAIAKAQQALEAFQKEHRVP